MFAKKTVVLVATAVVGLVMGVGCSASDLANDPAARALSEPSVDSMRVDSKETAPAPAPVNVTSPVRPKPSTVTCEGDQNHGGRICCDATHCCINILGVINCKLPPRKQ